MQSRLRRNESRQDNEAFILIDQALNGEHPIAVLSTSRAPAITQHTLTLLHII
ncbi:hypothetical protein XBKB1_950005 [Xenorhabdus bovienii str. kraussei Becker Underwood]|uniref:Uncharacterized protein n=1 Tax=Xenorhabdus bovienii str. kraussei Becker Underwood TaxID=1398204 RepID=A0A077PR80_XENBV|nr:hypothetical protein XBKB1_950005 [Xenorhabdus bovienii str. kraussei Becker Underwood]